MPLTETSDEYLPATQTELSRWMTENAAQAARPIYPVGGRTALNFGPPVQEPGITVATSKLARVIDYPARDMTITVEAGIRIEELATVLRTERQRLPIDIPQGHRATLGGAVAANANGSRRYGLGTLRDYVIGVSAVDAAGRLFKAGGRVVKNVAGYDLCKMLIGSWGTLGVITQLTLKLRPEPETSALLWVSFDQLEAIEPAVQRLLASAARPVAMDVLNPRSLAALVAEAGLELPQDAPVLCVGVEGTEREVAWQVETLRAELAPLSPSDIAVVSADAAQKLWFALAEFQVPSDEPVTFKANLLPSRSIEFAQRADQLGVALQLHAANGIVHGHLPDSTTTVAAARTICDPLRQLAAASGGNLVIWNCDPLWKAELQVLGHPEPAAHLMRELKKQLDPRHLLNPHRFGDPVPVSV